MTKGEQVIKIAEKEVGYSEYPANSNRTKYGKWFGWDGVAWCAMFVSWCYDKTGFTLKGLGWPKGFAGCQAGYDRFKKLGLITKTPAPGDIVLFDWNGDGRFDHVGIYVKTINSKQFEAIEGNTSLTNQSNGGMVMRRTRKFPVDPKKYNCVFVNILN